MTAVTYDPHTWALQPAGQEFTAAEWARLVPPKCPDCGWAWHMNRVDASSLGGPTKYMLGTANCTNRRCYAQPPSQRG